MRYALVNPNWSFDGSVYFGCRDPHLPLELGYSQTLLEAAGHSVLLVDAGLEEMNPCSVHERLAAFQPDITVLTTAPSYLFWRCPPPELRVPQHLAAAIRNVAGKLVAIGPHASTTPLATLRKLGADAVVLGECESVLPELARADWKDVSSIAWVCEGQTRVQGGPRATDLSTLPALRWPSRLLLRHSHHHHRFDGDMQGLGAEMEASRGCPYSCTFCAKQDHRDVYRKRPLATVLEELDALIAQGVRYVYFIDEIFLPNRELLEALREREVRFGVQTRIDLWSFEMLDLLGAAGCVSIEAGVESIRQETRNLLNKRCKLDTDALAARLVHARKTVPFVQASLIMSLDDDANEIETWRQDLLARGVWVNKPVPMFPYPGSAEYVQLWGKPDDQAWERAVDYYLERFGEFSDIQDQAPLPVKALELRA